MIGGSRSGKSAAAEARARELGGARVLYVATATVPDGDAELQRRVEEHRRRRPAGWSTAEVSYAVEGGLIAALEEGRGSGAVLVDSLTLWVSGVMLAGRSEEEVLEEFEGVLSRAAGMQAPVVLVTDEVGQGVVPPSAEGRRFRDLLGLVNQRAAAVSEEVHFCVAGIPVRIQ
ncbi:MAG: bifunctional adenosylcobinamide kinase/adenosylcobinamide-phosphate guanylyltransferase [Rubrobacter sp.]|nr:bifunctional adenosylcobinamide kinase/adenosylcobinamide-phosphate guanylyltransferase [Rubrobacter sp.]